MGEPAQRCNEGDGQAGDHDIEAYEPSGDLPAEIGQCRLLRLLRRLHAGELAAHCRGHLLRGIDRLLDLRELRQHQAPFYSDISRPSIDTELMVTYCMSIHGIEGDLPMNSATEE